MQYAAEITSQLTKAGHKCVPFYCGGMQYDCYDRYVNGSGLVNCFKCQVKQRLHLGKSSRIPKMDTNYPVVKINSDSTVASIVRAYEFSNLDNQNAQIVRASIDSALTQFSTRFNKWLDQEKLDFCLLFNGRFDLTKMALEILKSRNIQCVTHERSWFGFGLNLNLNESCMSLKKFSRFTKSTGYSKLVTRSLARAIIEPRFHVGAHSNEWKTFKGSNTLANHVLSNDKLNVLFLPSSPSEYMKEPDWCSPFQDLGYTLRTLAEKFKGENLLVKGHPIWSQNIKKLKANDVDAFCEKLSIAYDFTYLKSDSGYETNDIIRRCDLVITAGSSSALQAGILGKPIINLGFCEYSHSDFVKNITSPNELDTILDLVIDSNPKSQEDKTLDFLYSFSMQKMHFSDKTYLASSSNPQFLDDLYFEQILCDDFLNKDYQPTFTETDEVYINRLERNERLGLHDFLHGSLCGVNG